MKFINLEAERVFHAQQHYAEEVFEVTKSVLELPSDIYRKAEMAEKPLDKLGGLVFASLPIPHYLLRHFNFCINIRIDGRR